MHLWKDVRFKEQCPSKTVPVCLPQAGATGGQFPEMRLLVFCPHLGVRCGARSNPSS